MVAKTRNLPAHDMLDALAGRYVDVESLPWEQGAGPGQQWKILLEDKERGMLTALIRWAPGASLPMHIHNDIEQTFVLEGSLCDDEGECKAGQYVWRPAGSRHRAWSPDGCLLFAVFLKPNTFLEGPLAKRPTP